LKTQDGSKLHAQLTWPGDDTKQAKFRAGWQLIGKYIVYNSKSTELTFTNKNIPQEIFTKLTAALQSLPANWSIRSSVNNKIDIELLRDEAKEIYHIATQIETNHAECYLGIANYLKIFRELSISDDLEVTTNCQNIHAELIKKQDLWLIDAISYKKTLTPSIDISEINQPCVTLENGSMLDIGSYAGINIIDINSGSNNTNKQTTNFLILDEVYRQICIRNLQGIILVDVIKDSSLLHNEKIISYLQKLFRQDISQTKILGFSNSGLLEIIRNKF
ncbi:MAG: ribonuclease E/G, partial [Burkholderiales bacterium]|nr:ribonuclease E/G [Burkholderiales bacterium]